MAQVTVQTPDTVREIPADGPAAARLLTELLRHSDLPLNTRCGQRGLCDGCLVELVAGKLEPAEGGPLVSANHQPRQLRACQYRLPAGGQATVHVPARSLLAHRPQVVTSFRAEVSRAHDPLWQSLSLSGDELPAGADTTAAVCAAIARRRDHDLPVRASGPLASWSGHAEQRFLLDHQGEYWSLSRLADESSPAYGAAIDIGTTTVVAMLVELGNGQIVRTASALNLQTRLGDNVVTRINLCLQNKQMVARLQHAVAKRTLRPLLEEICSGGPVEPGEASNGPPALIPSDLKSLVVAGNTTMLHLLVGADPTPLGTVPFTPQFLEHRVHRSRALAVLPRQPPGSSAENSESCGGPAEAGDPTLHLLPGASAYVGADVVAGVFATGMAYRDEPCLLVDVGTNGEIVLKWGDRLLGCATAAGPAFEGSGLTCGVRAGHGAIAHVRLESGPERLQPQVEVIGGGPPIGICGTAYIDFLAEGRTRGLLGPTGRFAAGAACQQVQHPPGRRYPLARGADEREIVISERDLASLLQAKAAIAAGVVCLLDRLGLTPDRIGTLYLAGGFGFHMDVANVLRCGLLPGFRPEQIELVGNTSLAGAYLALMDSSALAEMKRIALRLETVELNLEPQFESLYIDHLLLP